MYPLLFKNRQYFFSGLAHCPHVYVSDENDQRKHVFSKTLSRRVKIFENTSFLFACGRMKMEVFEYDNVIHHK